MDKIAHNAIAYKIKRLKDHEFYFYKNHPNWIPFTYEIEVIFATDAKSAHSKIFSLIEWCEENCKSRFAFIADFVKTDYRFIFENEQEAIYFKMFAL